MKTLPQPFLLLLSTLLPAASAFQLGPLLSTCIDACQKGCDEIRQCYLDQEGDGSVVVVERKDANDPRSVLTLADQAAQAAILGSLRQEWGSELNVVGEEDETATGDSTSDRTFASLCRTYLEDDLGDETPDIDPSRITIFVDPLDGTREFVEGRLENCQVLVGIAIDGEAVAGSIGIPFPGGSEGTSISPTIVYGLADFGTGVMGSPLTRGPVPLEKHIDGIKFPRPHHATGDNPVPVVSSCVDTVIRKFGGSNVVYGGAGNKILAAALGEVACSIQHKVGGPWDLCAPEAIIKAMGGGFSDLFGEPIDMYRPDSPRNANERGF